MRKIISFIIIVIFQAQLVSCSLPASDDSVVNPKQVDSNDKISKKSSSLQSLTADEEEDLKLLAWNYLVEKGATTTITHPYTDAVLAETFVDNIETITVTFSTTDNALLGPIVVYINAGTKQVTGIAKRF
jgi:hypothetical protein